MLPKIFQQNPDADRLIVAGDFGFHPANRSLKSFKWNILPKVAFIDGNHDDIPALHSNPLLKGYSFKWIPRSSIIQDGLERKWLCIGGADSVDRSIRCKNGYFWTKKERISQENINRALAIAKINKIYGIISHTAPLKFIIPTIDDIEKITLKRKFDLYSWDLDACRPSRLMLDIILDEICPNAWIFGHFHISAKGKFKQCLWVALEEAHANMPMYKFLFDDWIPNKNTSICLENI